jgi:hypothetical protein
VLGAPVCVTKQGRHIYRTEGDRDEQTPYVPTIPHVGRGSSVLAREAPSTRRAWGSASCLRSFSHW